MLDSAARPVHLTDREIEVLKHIAAGLDTREIADVLSISHQTVRKHIENILAKMNAANRAHMVALAISYGLIDVGMRSER